MHELAFQSCLGAAGLPLGVQIVGKRFCEETVLKVMKLVEDGRADAFP